MFKKSFLIHPLVVLMTAFTSSETAVDAMKKSAYDYISEFFKTEDVKLIVNNGIGKNFEKNRLLKKTLNVRFQLPNIVDKFAAFQKIFGLIEKNLISNPTVLIN